MDNNSAVSCLRFEMTYYCYYVSLPDISLKSFPFFAVCTNCTFFFLPKMKWYFVTKIVVTRCEKNCSSDREKLFKFVDEGQEFAKFLRSLEQFIQTVKGQNSFW